MQTTKPQAIASLSRNWNVQFSVLFVLFILMHFFYSCLLFFAWRPFEFIHLTVAFRLSNSCTALHNLAVLSLLFIKCIEIEFNCPILWGCCCLTPRVYWFSFPLLISNRFAQLQLQFVYTNIIYEFDAVWEMGNRKIGKNTTTIVHSKWMRCCVQMNVHSACGTMSTAWEVFQLKLIELICFFVE